MGRGGLSLIAAISFPPLPRSPRGDHAISPRDAAFSLATRLSLPPPPARPPAFIRHVAACFWANAPAEKGRTRTGRRDFAISDFRVRLDPPRHERGASALAGRVSPPFDLSRAFLLGLEGPTHVRDSRVSARGSFLRSRSPATEL